MKHEMHDARCHVRRLVVDEAMAARSVARGPRDMTREIGTGSRVRTKAESQMK